MFLTPWLYHQRLLHSSYSFTEMHHRLAVEDQLPECDFLKEILRFRMKSTMYNFYNSSSYYYFDLSRKNSCPHFPVGPVCKTSGSVELECPISSIPTGGTVPTVDPHLRALVHSEQTYKFPFPSHHPQLLHYQQHWASYREKWFPTLLMVLSWKKGFPTLLKVPWKGFGINGKWETWWRQCRKTTWAKKRHERVHTHNLKQHTHTYTTDRKQHTHIHTHTHIHMLFWN